MCDVKVGDRLLVEKEVAKGLVGFRQLLNKLGSLLLGKLEDFRRNLVRLDNPVSDTRSEL